jgi:hypothetical protein
MAMRSLAFYLKGVGIDKIAHTSRALISLLRAKINIDFETAIGYQKEK